MMSYGDFKILIPIAIRILYKHFIKLNIVRISCIGINIIYLYLYI